jgi:hypothetical protein
MEDLERLARRARMLPLAGILLALVGFGTGNLSRQYIDLPGGNPTIGDVGPRTSAHHIDLLSQRMVDWLVDGDSTMAKASFYRDEVEPVERVLRDRGIEAGLARQVAWPLTKHARSRDLDPAFVLSIVLIESAVRPAATSPVGARGLMQVMPLWVGHWRDCGLNLYDIEANLCSGTSILDWYLGRFPGDERRALLAYNGCVRGTNTPNCHTYPDKVARLRGQLARELELARAAARVGPSLRWGAAASP